MICLYNKILIVVFYYTLMSEFALKLFYNDMCPVHEPTLVAMNNPIYSMIKHNIIPELNTLNIVTYVVPTPLTKYGNYWPDYDGDYIQTYCAKDFLNSQYMYFIVYLDTRESTYRINTKKPIKINFKCMNVETKINVIKIFEKYLHNYYVWSGSNETPMYIMYEAKNFNPIQVANLKDDDTYPYLSIYIASKLNLFEHNNVVCDIVDFIKKYVYQSGVFKQVNCMRTIDISIKGIHSKYNIENACNMIHKMLESHKHITNLKITHWIDKNKYNTYPNN